MREGGFETWGSHLLEDGCVVVLGCGTNTTDEGNEESWRTYRAAPVSLPSQYISFPQSCALFLVTPPLDSDTRNQQFGQLE